MDLLVARGNKTIEITEMTEIRGNEKMSENEPKADRK